MRPVLLAWPWRLSAMAMRKILVIAGLVPTLAASPALASDARQVVRDYVVSHHPRDDYPPGFDKDYRIVETDLNGDGVPEIVAYLKSQDFCGSGGCALLALQRRPSGAKAVMRATITRPPIRVLSTASHGWRDIAVQVGGGGLRPHEVVLKFSGTAYPSNPSMPPARPAKAGARGKVLIGEDE